MTLFPIRLWHCGHLKQWTVWVWCLMITEQTYIRLSVTLTRFDSSIISFLATLTFLALLISRTTLVSKIGSRSASIKNCLTFWAVTSGGRSCRVSTVSNRGPWRLIKSRAGCRKSTDLSEVGRRYIRKRVRNMLLVGVSGWYILLQYLNTRQDKNQSN